MSSLDQLLADIEKRCAKSPTLDYKYIKNTREDIPKLINTIKIMTNALGLINYNPNNCPWKKDELRLVANKALSKAKDILK